MTLSFIQWLGGLVTYIDAAIVQVVVRPLLSRYDRLTISPTLREFTP